MSRLITIQMPISLSSFGLPLRLQTRTACLTEGDPAWAWDGIVPPLGVSVVESATGEGVDEWDLDHIVLLVPDLESAVSSVHPVLGAPRLRTTVEGRPTSFYRVGPLLEVIESPVRAPALFGVALVTTRPLEEVVAEWRDLGHRVTEPHPAIQPGRSIFTVKGTSAGFAVMSPDGPTG